MKKSCVIFILLFISNFSSIFADQIWVQRYNGPGNSFDRVLSMYVDKLGNVYITGVSVGSGTSDDIATIKYNNLGVQQWIQRYSTYDMDEGQSLVVDVSGNVFITGESGASCVTIKYNSSGVQQWIKFVGNACGRGITLDKDGNVLVTGWVDSSGQRYLTIKYNPNGVLQWARSYKYSPGNYFDFGNFVGTDWNNNVYVGGTSCNGSNVESEDIATIKYDASGTQQWVQRYNGPGNYYDDPYAMAVDSLGNVYITGESCNNIPSFDFVTIKYNTFGIQQWVARYNGPGNYYDGTRAIAIDRIGNVYVTGPSASGLTMSSFDYATIKYNSNGVQQWVSRYNGSGNDYDFSSGITVDSQSNVYVSGDSWSGTNDDFATIKYNSLGAQEWVQKYVGPVNYNENWIAGIGLDGNGNVYIAGCSQGINSNQDYTTIKYSQIVGIFNKKNSMSDRYSVFQNYPNPFNSSTKIKFNIPSLGVDKDVFVKLNVFDILGKELAVLVNEKLGTGEYEVEWDSSNYPSGMYFYELSSDYGHDTKKMILVK